MDSSANVEGLVLFIVIILVLFMIGGTLCWAGLWRWRKGMDKATVDLEQLETLLDEQNNNGGGGGGSRKKKGGKSKSKSSTGKSKSKSKSKSGRKKSEQQSEWDVGAEEGGGGRPQSEWDVGRQSSRPQSEWNVRAQSAASAGPSEADTGSTKTDESAMV